MRKGSALAVLVFGSSLLACVAAAPDDVGSGEQEFSTTPGEPNHEAITADGLSFLRSEVILALQAANVSTDVQFVLNSATHFDDCNFSGGSQWVRDHEAAAVSAIGGGDDATAFLEIARSLHALQDFYAHSNWVESGARTLVDASTTAFPLMTGYVTLSPSGLLVVDGTTPPEDLALSRRRGAKYPANAIVYTRLGKQTGFGLISGTVDYEPGNSCPAQVAMTHDELNKDKSTIGRTAQYVAAKSLATQQTRHEWCRLLTMTRAAHGEAGDKTMFSWVSDAPTASQCGAGTDVSVTATAPANLALGSTGNVDVLVANSGAAAYGTTVRIVLSTGLVPTTLPSSCSLAVATSATVDCYVGLLASGATSSLAIGVTAALPGAADATATVTAHVPETNAANNTATATTTVDAPL